MQIPLDLKGSKTRDEIRRLQMRSAMPPEFYEQKGNDDGVKEVEVKSILTEFHFRALTLSATLIVHSISLP